ncbi:MAG: DNA translocase FtsK [Dehalococcoidia bacterium]
MAASPRTPRAAAARRPKPSRPAPRPFDVRSLIPSSGLVWAVGGAAGVVFIIFLWMINLPGLLTNGAEWLLKTMGLGLVVVFVWSLFGGYALSNRIALASTTMARRSAGIIAAGLFAWGALGLNAADWSFGDVDFAEVSTGGEIGKSLVAGWLGKVTWVSLGLLTSYLLAPKFSLAVLEQTPRGLAYTWRQRWPHRVAHGIVAFFRGLAPGDDSPDSDAVIGATLRGRLDPTPLPTTESPPKRIRRKIDADEPSPLGAGAASQFTHEEAAAPAELKSTAVAEDAVPFEVTPPPGSSWQYPSIDMLNPPMPAATRKHDNKARAELIVDTLSSFGVDASVVEVNEGPTVTQFGVEPGWEVRYRDLPLKDPTGKGILGPDGRPRTERVEIARTRVRVNRITALQNDLALALAAPSLRIEAPVPGRAIVGIEVPNDAATVVTMRTVMETKEFGELARKSKLALALGKGVSGVPVVADLARMPHLLIAGATGSGKSVCMNTIIAGIMMNASPDEVRFVMIDPKRVELTPYTKIPHLAFSEVIVDMDKVVGTLQAVVAEMEARYKRFAELAVRNIEGYNKHPNVLRKLPYWVVIIDELADLMMAAPFEVEKLICRLAQLARATGIHLVVATQRPSVDVITGLIKANFPTRIAFATTSMTDSRTILDTGGAEKLLGRGDMLFMPVDAAKPIRIQGVYLSDAEVERLVEFWTDDRFKYLAPEKADSLLEQALVEQNGGDADIELDEDDDPLLDQARELALQHSRVSPSLFQRRLRVGYVKACRLVDALEDEGIVGPREDGESRRVTAGAGSHSPIERDW